MPLQFTDLFDYIPDKCSAFLREDLKKSNELFPITISVLADNFSASF